MYEALKLKSACEELLAKIDAGMSSEQLEKEKVYVARKYSLDRIIKNADLLAIAREKNLGNDVIRFLRTKPMRTLSGVANIAVMWLDKEHIVDGKPFSCPYKCIYCAQGDRMDAKGVRLFAPKSYIGVEPTTLRAIRNNYDPFLQVRNRLRQLEIIGHAPQKCELIVMGGTFLSWNKNKQENFIQRCMDAMNNTDSTNIEESQTINESAPYRCIGLTIETRADYCSQRDIDWMLHLGATRVEIGVQSTDSDLLIRTNRGHDAKKNVEVIKLVKDNGLKMCAHWMPGLTGIDKLDLDKELEMFEELFENEHYRPDELKIYPALVIPGTELHELWVQGKYKPLGVNDAIELLIRMKQIIPPYVRVKRISRDISEKEISAGAKVTNLRQITHIKMKELGIKCNCIRCREVRNRKIENVELRKIEYDASDGREFFLSFEDTKNNSIIAFIRLRLTDKAFVRELHVYGEQIPISHERWLADSPMGKKVGHQHMSLGKQLLAEAEKIAASNGYKKLHVTSGVGVRGYYRNLIYKLDKPYMVKEL